MEQPTTLINTTQLIRRYRDGDSSAREQLVSRYLPLLRKWAHGRLPSYGRDLAETDDLIQVTFLRAINRLKSFEAEQPGAFFAYLRSIMLNVIRDELRRRQARPRSETLADSMPAQQTSMVEQMVGEETLQAYEQALSTLAEEKRLAVIMRVEFELSYADIAHELALSSANATRMMVTRALSDVALAMGR